MIRVYNASAVLGLTVRLGVVLPTIQSRIVKVIIAKPVIDSCCMQGFHAPTSMMLDNTLTKATRYVQSAQLSVSFPARMPACDIQDVLRPM